MLSIRICCSFSGYSSHARPNDNYKNAISQSEINNPSVEKRREGAKSDNVPMHYSDLRHHPFQGGYNAALTIECNVMHDHCVLQLLPSTSQIQPNQISTLLLVLKRKQTVTSKRDSSLMRNPTGLELGHLSVCQNSDSKLSLPP